MTGPIQLACAVEGPYRAHSAAMLHSAIVNAGAGGAHVHYLHGPTYPDASLRRIRGMIKRLGARVSFYPIATEHVSDLPVLAEFTSAMWYRVMLPELVPELDRVLYLDVDTIVTDSLTPLWRTDLTGHLVGAVTNVLLDKHRHRPAELGLDAGSYFNSGVLLMNLDEMRRARSSAAIREYAGGRGRALDWPDQDALNVVLGKRRLALHPRWNAMNALWLREAGRAFAPVDLSQALAHPAIRHFEGPGDNKPWHAGCRQRHAESYFRHRRRTPWPWCRRAGSPADRARRVVRGIGLRPLG